MFCEAYNQSLKNAAARGETLSSVLQQHLASCASCSAAFAEEQSLFAAIDSGLRAVSKSEVPATLIPRVCVALNNEPAPQSRSFNFLVWAFAGSVITAAVVLALVYLPSKHQSVSVEPSRPSPVAAAQNLPVPSAVNSVRMGGVSPLQHRKPSVLVVNRGLKPESPEVLVPDEERAAFAQFMAHASASSANVSAKTTLVPRAPQESVQISPVEIASLELRPLEQKEERQSQF